MTRLNSSSTDTGGDPGRVDSPPISIMSAPSAIMFSACVMAKSKLAYIPPSEKESGVTFNTPMTKGRNSAPDILSR